MQISMALQVHVDETNCGPLCQHPSCWQSNTRQAKGFPKLRARPPPPPDIELDLPTLKVCNMLEDYGDDNRDLFPSKFGGKPAHERNERYTMLQKPIRTQSIKVTRAPQTSPKSTNNGVPVAVPSKFKVVEVQEVFDPEDLRGTWDDTFVPKSYYVWVPNAKKKRRRKRQEKNAQESGMTKLKGKGTVKFKDMTEDMVPRELEHSRITARLDDEWPILKKKRASTKSPTMMNHGYPMSARTNASSRMELDQEGDEFDDETFDILRLFSQYRSTNSSSNSQSEDNYNPGTEPHVTREISVTIPSRVSGWRTPGQISVTIPSRVSGSQTHGQIVYSSISELLDLPRDVLIQVLQNTRQSDLMSREKIREIIRKYMPPNMERGNTNISMASQDLLQQKKLNLHEGNKNIRQSHLMETKPVFHLDDDVIDDEEIDEDIQRGPSPYGSLKDLYFGTGSSKDLNKYKKPLPSILGGGRAVSAGDAVPTKIPSISLGLPELPSGIRQTKAFTYSKKIELDFTLAPVPTPPTSFRSVETPGSDHGTTIRVNLPSQASVRSDHESDRMDRKMDSPARVHSDHPLHAVSPTFSTGVPNAPATTPATYGYSPTKSAPLLRDMTGSMTNTPQEWPSRDKQNSPLHILRAPVNTPGSLMQENTGLVPIQEIGANKEEEDTPLPISRGRSVRFEIPEVPPPPSSPQLSDDGQKDVPSRNIVTVNTTLPQETPSTSSNKPTSGATVRTDATTVNTSTLQAENSFVRSTAGPIREVSIVSSPEPWPQVNEADFDVAPLPTPASTTHESPHDVVRIDTDTKTPDFDNQSRNAKEEIEGAQDENVEDKEKDEEFINKTEEQSAAVKKMVEDSRKASSPAPPPPSPEAKEDSEIIINKSNGMETLVEENEPLSASDDEVSMTVTQIAPKGSGGRKSIHRQIDTFQNIDIPATFNVDSKQAPKLLPEPSTMTIPEEQEPTPEQFDNSNRDIALSVQSTLANRTISEQAHSEVSSSVIEPAISQASHGPALSEDYSEKRDGNSDVFVDWSGVIVGSEGQDSQALLSSDKQEMTEEGGDHDGFKDDLRQEFEKIKSEIESTNDDSELS